MASTSSATDEVVESDETRMKKTKIDLASALEHIGNNTPTWKKIRNEGLDLDYSVILPKNVADEFMSQLEHTIEYYQGDLTKVKVFGKWYDVPRQQVAYGDDGLQYHFSGVTLPAKPWIESLKLFRDFISKITQVEYNFVLVNRYRNGLDHIGEHRDGEAELDPSVPIASVSLGQHRNFVLKHAECRGKGKVKSFPRVKIELEHGSLLLMNPPTNRFWYHSLPKCKAASCVRINLTFRKILNTQIK